MGEDVKLPEGWKKVKLGEVLTKEHQKVGVKNKNIYIPVAVGELGLRDRTEIYGEDKILTENTEKYLIFPYSSICFGLGSKSLAVDVNDVLYSKYSVSPAYKIFKFDYKKYNPSFFRKYFKFLKESIGDKFLVLSARQGKKIDEEILLNYTISLPPLPEQQKIAEILETVDRAIEKTDKIIEKYKRIKQGLMQDLLTKGIDENGKIRSEKTHKFKDSPIGRIPEEWEVVRLGEKVYLNPEKLVYKKNTIIEYIDIESVSEGKIENIKTFKIEEAPSRAQRLVKVNDIIVSTVRPNLKAFALILEKYNNFICSTGFAILRVKNDLDPLFLFYLVLYDNIFLKQILPLIVGSNYPAINSIELIKIQIPLPPLPEQQRIAEILSQIDNVIEKEQAYRQKLERIKKGLMEDLLTGKVRVNKLIKEREV